MPTISDPAPPDNRHLQVISTLTRNDSLKSERSDKRVSFNNDVGIKHIPRGTPPAKQQTHLPPAKAAPPDEWAECKPVKLQPNNLTEEQVEQEAASIRDLVDSIDCRASPIPPKEHKDFTSRSLDRTQKRSNNVRANGVPNGVNHNRITNPLIRHLKADVNRREARRRGEIYSDSDSDRNRASRHKSVPNLLAASYNNGTSKRVFNGLDPAVNYSSVDNLLDEKNTNIIHGGKEPRPLHNSHLSADNLLDAPAGRENLTGYKSLGNLPVVSDTDSTDMSYGYRPKVNQIIQRFNGDTEERPRNADLNRDREGSPTRGVIAPTRKHRHNNNKPFSYTEPQQVSTLQKVRNISPTRDVTAEDMYAQVNKHGIRQRLSMDSDYSAKIIITEDRPKTYYEGDDEAYETYQVQSNPIRNNRFSDYGLNLSKNSSVNNNINMSSVAVQTDTSKILKRERRPPKAMAPQPPVHEPYIDNYRIKKDLSSDLPSANLVRQINHGFGRFDRSPSPPPRKAFNRSNPRHVVPLLSDTSDSEPDYRRRSDPLAKIRNQVLIGEKLQEEHDAEEWEEREMEKFERDKRNLNYNPNAMRPLTVDEVDALSLELDQHGDRKLVVSQKSGEKRSSSHHTTHQSHVIESHADRSYSEDRSRPIKPLREKTPSNRDSSASRQITLERNKKNNLEKEKLAQEKKAMEMEKENDKKLEKEALKTAKGKDKKNKEPKEKKKKRIKIKFFYDPRPHDKSTEDPLSRFTEYKGTDRKESDEIRNTTKTTRSRSYDSRSHSRERRSEEEISVDPRHTRDSSRERTLARPDRNKKTAASTDRLHYGRTGSGNDPSSHDDSNDERRRVRSTDSYDRRNRYENTRLNVESRDDRRTRTDYNDDRNRRGYGSSDIHEKKYDSSNRRRNDSGSGRDNYDYRQDPYSSNAVERRNTFLERREAYEHRDSSVNRRDSRRDSSENRYKYRDDERDAGRHYGKGVAPENGSKEEDKYTSSPDEDNKQERVMRQRKKFLSALMSDGRAKSSNLSSPPPAPPPAGYTGHDNGVSTLKRSQSSVQEVHRNGRGGYVNDKLGHESDPPPPPSVVMSNNTKSSESPKKQTSSKKPKAKKKKKSWSWGFLGLRSNKRKKSKPTSRAGSEAGSNLGGSPLKRGNHLLNQSRPASRASSNRSSTRPPRPFVRASKIRKDLSSSGRVWSSSRALHDQRKETSQWESSTLQRPVGAMPSRDRRPMTLDDRRTPVGERFTSNSRGPRRTSEGSSESSAHRGGDRTMGFKQRYFGDSDNNDQSSRRTPRGGANNTKSGSGPGDYRSLPNRSTTRAGVGGGNKIGGAGAGRRVVGGGGGSAGSSLQSSESENDSHQGSRASHVSTGSNRSVYLHATAVADIPVQKSGEDSDRAAAVQRQTRKVTRSFSLLAPWKPRHPREQPPTQHLEYDSRDAPSRHAAKPPRPPRRSAEPVARSHTMTNKDSKLSGWLKKRKNKEGKGI